MKTDRGRGRDPTNFMRAAVRTSGIQEGSGISRVEDVQF